jgi:hypothetical protein
VIIAAALALSLQPCLTEGAWLPIPVERKKIPLDAEYLYTAGEMDHYLELEWCLSSIGKDEHSHEVLHLSGSWDSACGPLKSDVYCFSTSDSFDLAKNSPVGVACKAPIIFDQCTRF